MYDFSNLLDEHSIFLPLVGESRHSTLRTLSDALATRTEIDSRDILEAIIERERLGSTGVGDGVAIPHARLRGLTKSVGAFARLETPIEFDAIDERPCDLIFMLLAPESDGGDHLRALAQVSRAFRQAEFRSGLRALQGVEEAKSFLLKPERNVAA